MHPGQPSPISIPVSADDQAQAQPRRRRRSTAAERTAAIAGWEAAGTTIVAYATAHGLDPKTLSRWIREQRGSESKASGDGFVPVATVGSAIGTQAHWELPDGLGVVVGPPADLARVIAAALRACPV